MKWDDFVKFREAVLRYIREEEGFEDIDSIEGDRAKKTISVTALRDCLVKAAFNTFYRPVFVASKPAKIGTVLHANLEDTIKRNWEEISKDIENLMGATPEFERWMSYSLKDGWKLIGRADLIVNNEIYEFKFKGSKNFEKVEDGNMGYDEDQLNAYLCMSADSKIGFLWVFNSDEFNNPGFEKSLKTKVVKPNKEKFDEMVHRAEKVIDIVNMLESGSLPVEEILKERKKFREEGNTMICKGCPYKAVCNYIESTVGGELEK